MTNSLKPAAGERQRALRSDAQNNRAALLKAARALVSERGAEALTVAAVARRAGLNRSTAYQHFKDREQILDAVSEAFADEVQRIFSEPRDIGTQIGFFVDYFSAHPDIARIWMFRLLTGQEENPSGWADYVGALERLARSSRSQAGIDAEMLGIIGMTSALVWSLMTRQRTQDPNEQRSETARFAHELKRLFLYGALRPERWPELTAEFESSKM
jgi:AcrR family transcriptional regulator